MQRNLTRSTPSSIPAGSIAIALLLQLCGCAASDAESVGRGEGGVELKRDADVFYGSAFTCTRPAVFDFDRVKESTPQWRTIQAERVQPGSARYQILTRELRDGLRERLQQLAVARKCDLVVRSGDIRDARGHDVVDLTEEMLER
jgi:hypothetical protein